MRRKTRRIKGLRTKKANIGKILLIIGLLFLVYFALANKKIGSLEVTYTPQISTSGFLKVNVKAYVQDNYGIVVLKSNCWELVGYTEREQARSIALGIEKKIEFRPLTHDLIKDIFDSYGIKILMVKVVDIKNNTFIAETILQQGNKVLTLDSRPSDGIAIAVRYDAPVYVKKELMENYGKYVC